jgi:hypothetical protein
LIAAAARAYHEVTLMSAYLVDQKGKTMKFKMTIGASVVMTALLVVLTGCQKQEGPAEKAGQKIDKAVEKTGEKIDQTAEKVGEKVEKAGEKIQDATKRDEKK